MIFLAFCGVAMGGLTVYGVHGLYTMIKDGPLTPINKHRKEVVVALPNGGLAIKKVPYEHPLGDAINTDEFWDDVEHSRKMTFGGFTSGREKNKSGSDIRGTVREQIKYPHRHPGVVQDGTGPAAEITYRTKQYYGADGRLICKVEKSPEQFPESSSGDFQGLQYCTRPQQAIRISRSGACGI